MRSVRLHTRALIAVVLVVGSATSVAAASGARDPHGPWQL